MSIETTREMFYTVLTLNMGQHAFSASADYKITGNEKPKTFPYAARTTNNRLLTKIDPKTEEQNMAKLV